MSDSKFINIKNFIFYKIPNSYSSQIEGSGISLRLGFTVIGVAPKSWHDKHSYIRSHLSLISHTGQMGQWYILKIMVGRFTFGLRTRGETKPQDPRYKRFFYYVMRKREGGNR